MNVAVFGLGKIGLPLAVQFALQGMSVIGVDISPDVVEKINQGVEPFPNEKDLATKLRQVTGDGHLRATSDGAWAMSQSQTIVIAVPLFVDGAGSPDFDNIDAVAQVVGEGIKSGSLVSIETTVPIGTTRDRVVPTIAGISGLRPSEDFYAVFSPERVFTGRVFEDLQKYPKLIGGICDDSERLGIEFYQKALTFQDRPDLARPNGVWSLGSCEAAEFAKLAETTYRDVNIALANQFALYAGENGMDIFKIIEACNSQPFSQIHTPGISVGGHCIPIYPQLYLHADPSASIVSLARQVNSEMPEVAVAMLESEVGDLNGKRVAILGLSYRAGVKETAFSGALELVRHLSNRGAHPMVHDPQFEEEEIRALGIEPFRIRDSVDAVILHTEHPEYLEWELKDCPSAEVLLDGRHIIDPSRWEASCKVRRL